MNEKRSASLAHTFKLLVLVNCLCLAALAGAFMYQRSAQADAQAASQGQYKSYLLADEFRQSSDDLTRLVRTYAATGDSKYEKWYNQVIAMRNGEISRPQEPHRIYWDLILKDGDAPRPAGERKPLLEQMVEAGFTPAEMQLLEEGKKRSDALVQLEVRAMEAVKKADLKLATDLLYSEDYHKAKASVMEPVDKFFSLIGQRTAALGAEDDQVEVLARIGDLGGDVPVSHQRVVGHAGLVEHLARVGEVLLAHLVQVFLDRLLADEAPGMPQRGVVMHADQGDRAGFRHLSQQVGSVPNGAQRVLRAVGGDEQFHVFRTPQGSRDRVRTPGHSGHSPTAMSNSESTRPQVWSTISAIEPGR